MTFPGDGPQSRRLLDELHEGVPPVGSLAGLRRNRVKVCYGTADGNMTDASQCCRVSQPFGRYFVDLVRVFEIQPFASMGDEPGGTVDMFVGEGNRLSALRMFVIDLVLLVQSSVIKLTWLTYSRIEASSSTSR